MNKIDNSIKFVSINIGLVTISDSRNEDNDKSGNLLKEKEHSSMPLILLNFNFLPPPFFQKAFFIWSFT